MLGTVLPPRAAGQEAVLDILPLRPFSFDVSFNDRTFAPTRRVISVQAGITALRYGPLELRGIYQYYSHHTPTFITDQHSLYANPRWNNFIDLLDFPSGKPISRMLRHVLFGPLEHRAVPYVGAILGGTIPGRGAFSPGFCTEDRSAYDFLSPKDFPSTWDFSTHDSRLISKASPTCHGNGSSLSVFDFKPMASHPYESSRPGGYGR